MADDNIARASTPMFAYSDGSGFEMTIRVTHVDGADWTVGIRETNSWVEFDAEKWPQIRAEVNRLLSAFAKRPSLAASPSPDTKEGEN